MKRSEAISIIEENGPMGIVDGYSDDILNALLKAGMLPPYSKKKDLGCECGCKGRCEVGHNWDEE